MITTAFKNICAVAVVGGCLTGSLFAADAGTVLPPAQRQGALDKARQVLTTKEAVPVAADPFHSERFAEMVSGASRANTPAVAAVGAPNQRTARDILQAIAASLTPSGNFVMNGEHTLVFGQKRVKAGDFLTITFEGAEYTLEITAIERTSFSLRLNREEFTRPIK